MAPLGVSFHLLIEDQDLVLSAILVPSDSNQFMLCPWAMSFFQKLCPAPFPPVTVGRIPWRRGSTPVFLGFPSASPGKESACSAGDLGLISGLGRSPGKQKDYPLQYSGLENSMGLQTVGHN